MTTVEARGLCRPADDRKLHLKVKIKSLAIEAGIIRLEERRMLMKGRSSSVTEETQAWAYRQFRRLQAHRKEIVRPEARISHLAYAFLRGTPYRTVEAKVRQGNEPDWSRVANCAVRFRYDGWTNEDRRTQTLRDVEAWKDVVSSE